MVDSGELEIFRHALPSVVEEMEVTLQLPPTRRTSRSAGTYLHLFDADRGHLAQRDA